MADASAKATATDQDEDVPARTTSANPENRDAARILARSLWLDLLQDELATVSEEERKARWSREGQKYVRASTKALRRLERQGFEMVRKAGNAEALD